MSERVRESILASLFASKRFVVAACAAIAMVLGAMSAGASVFTGEPYTAANHSSFTAPSSPPAAILGKNSALTKQHTLGGNGITSGTPRYTATQSSVKAQKNPLTNVLASTATNVRIFQDKAPVLEQLQPKDAGATTAHPTPDSSAEEPASPTPAPSTGSGTESQEPAPTEEKPATSPTNDPEPQTNGASLFSTDSAESAPATTE